MAGELLFHPFDRDRFQALLPLLGELDAARAVSAANRRALADVFRVQPASAWLASAFRVCARILAAPGIELRLHLRPVELDELIAAVVAACLPAWGEFSLVNGAGPTWVVLDEVQRTLMDEPWYDALVSGRARNAYAVSLPFPRRGERRWLEVTAAGREVLEEALPRLIGSAHLKPQHEAELEALRGFARGATGATGLVFTCLS